MNLRLLARGLRLLVAFGAFSACTHKDSLKGLESANRAGVAANNATALEDGVYLAKIEGGYRFATVAGRSGQAGYRGQGQPLALLPVTADGVLWRVDSKDRYWGGREILHVPPRQWIVGVRRDDTAFSELWLVRPAPPAWLGAEVNVELQRDKEIQKLSFRLTDATHALVQSPGTRTKELQEVVFLDCGASCRGIYSDHDQTVVLFEGDDDAGNVRLIHVDTNDWTQGRYARSRAPDAGRNLDSKGARVLPPEAWPEALLGQWKVGMVVTDFDSFATFTIGRGSLRATFLDLRQASPVPMRLSEQTPSDDLRVRIFKDGERGLLLELLSTDARERSLPPSLFSLIPAPWGWLVVSADGKSRAIWTLSRQDPPPWVASERFRREGELWCKAFTASLPQDVGPRRRVASVVAKVREATPFVTPQSENLWSIMTRVSPVMFAELYAQRHLWLGVTPHCPKLAEWTEKNGEKESERADAEDEAAVNAEPGRW